jgi:hypothetical protein
MTFASDAAMGARFADYAVLARALGENDVGGARAALGRVAGDAALVDTIRRHHLTSLLAATISEDELQGRLPARAFATLRDWLHQPRPSPEEHLATFAEVQAALERGGVECMLLKGAYFAHRLYGGLARRAQYDVDVVTRRRCSRTSAIAVHRRRRVDNMPTADAPRAPSLDCAEFLVLSAEYACTPHRSPPRMPRRW